MVNYPCQDLIYQQNCKYQIPLKLIQVCIRVIVLLFTMVLTFCVNAQIVNQGKATIPNKDPPIKLDGNWEYYQKELIYPGAFDIIENKTYLKFPGT
ncbi:MAG: hypothetical protein ACJA08_001054 [Cyclobacteriaceae bacterium]